MRDRAGGGGTAHSQNAQAQTRHDSCVSPTRIRWLGASFGMSQDCGGFVVPAGRRAATRRLSLPSLPPDVALMETSSRARRSSQPGGSARSPGGSCAHPVARRREDVQLQALQASRGFISKNVPVETMSRVVERGAREAAISGG
jgi:hypothetical protein